MGDPIVSISGLRGIVGDSFTPDKIVPYVAAFADMLKIRKVVVGGDSRPSRDWAQPTVESVLRARGVDVISIGLAPTPTVGMMVRRFGAGGGIAITASHNPIEWNGLKFFRASGDFLGTAENEKLRQLMRKPAGQGAAGRVGSLGECTDAGLWHLEQVRKVLASPARRRVPRLRVVLDCCNSTASFTGPLLASSYGVTPEVIFANPGRVFPRGAEPLAVNLKALRREVRVTGSDFGAAFDPDADRLALVDETARPIGEERTVVLAMDAYLRLFKGKGPLVVNLSTTGAVDRLAEMHGVRVFRTPIGEAHVLAGMREHDAAIGGEGNGGVILPEVHPGRDAATALALVILGLQHVSRPLSRWNASIPDPHMLKAKAELGKMPLSKVLSRARQAFKDATEVDERDGLKFLVPGGWIHLRPSNTEPIMRIFAEGEDKAHARALMARVEGVLG